MTPKEFQELLRFGQKFERKSLEFFQYDTVRFPEGKHSEYDYILNEDTDPITVEVKADKLAKKTGNICIEYAEKGKPSGLGLCTATYWVHYVCGSKWAYKIPLNDLQALVKGCRSMNGGNGRTSSFYLLPIKKLREYRVKRTDGIPKCR